MKRLVLGISLIFCLQLGFIAYTAVERQMEALVAVNEVKVRANLTDGKTGDLFNEEWPAVAEETIDTVKINSVAGAVAVTAPKRNSRTRYVPVPRRKNTKTSNAKPLNFPTHIIAYRKTPQVTFRTEYPLTDVALPETKTEPVTQTYAQPEKKSLVSKSVSIIKKPYDWLKALGSKFK